MPVRDGFLARLPFVEFAAILLVPVVLLGIYEFVPVEVQNSLAFHYRDPSVVSVWSSALVHEGWLHVKSNVLGYAIGVFPAFLVYEHWRRRRLFLVTFAVILAVTPLVTKTFDYVVVYEVLGWFGVETVSRGFSGVASAFGGMLLAVNGLMIADEHTRLIGWTVSLLIVVTAFTVLSVPTGVFSPLIAVLALVAVSLSVLQFTSHSTASTLQEIRSRVWDQRWNVFFTVYTGAIVVFIVVAIFPADVVNGDGFVNIFSHGTGFVSGAVLTAVTRRFKS